MTSEQNEQRYNGVKAYERAFEEGKIKSGDSILVFGRENQTPFSYTVHNANEVLSGTLPRKIRKVLQGKEWTIAPPQDTIDGAVSDDFLF